MGCYWGCGTKGNKVAWGLFWGLAIVGLALWIPGIVTLSSCWAQFANCSCNYNAAGVLVCSSGTGALFDACVSQYSSCVVTPAILWSVGWFLLALALIPLFYFCCCARGPQQGVPVGTTGNVIYTTQGPMYGSSQTQPPQAQYQYPQQAPSAAYPPQAAYAPQAAYETPGAFPQQAAYPPQAAYPQQAAYPPAGGYPKN